MIESPIFAEWWAQATQQAIQEVLEPRFGPLPPEIAVRLQAVFDNARLRELSRTAALCPDLEAFRAKLETNHD
jgi:hypothetical protein